MVDCAGGVGGLKLGALAERLGPLLPLDLRNAGGGGGGGGAGLNDGCGADFVQKERAVPAGCQDVPSGARSALHSLGASREHARVL